MAYIGANEVKAIREGLKARFPNLKFGCRKGSGSLSVEVTVKQGDVDFIGSYNSTLSSRPAANSPTGPRPITNGHMDINEYWYQDHFDTKTAEIIGDMIKIIKTAPDRKWYDRSDIQSDYFDTAYYIHLSVGAWDKPYALVK